MGRTQRNYEKEYKEQAVKLTKEIGSDKAARELGVPKGTLSGMAVSVQEGAVYFSNPLGSGPELDVDHLFDRFYQSNPARGKGRAGSGHCSRADGADGRSGERSGSGEQVAN